MPARFEQAPRLRLREECEGGAPELSETITLDGANFSGNGTTDLDTGPVYWMRWDLSSNNLLLPTGPSSFLITMDTENAVTPSWLFAPMDKTQNPYPGGRILGVAGNHAASDAGFAVTRNPEPKDFAITEVSYDGSLLTLTWDSITNAFYTVHFSRDLIDWGADLDDAIQGDAGDETTRTYDLALLGLEGEVELFFRVEREGSYARDPGPSDGARQVADGFIR